LHVKFGGYLRIIEKLKTTLNDAILEYLVYIFISKKATKKIALFNIWSGKIFIILLLYGIFSFGIFYIILGFDLFSDLDLRYSIAIAFVYSGIISIPSSIFFIEKFLFDCNEVADLFFNIDKLRGFMSEISKSHDRQKFEKIQKKLKYFDKGFSFIFSKYFRKYKGRIKIYREIMRECYFTFDKIINITSYSVETYKSDSSNLMIDFKRYLHDIEHKILIPILDREINIHEARGILKKWDLFFKENYNLKYEEVSKLTDEYDEKLRARFSFKKALKKDILLALIPALITIILFILSKEISI